MKKKFLFFLFFLSLIAFLFSPSFFKSIRLMAFAPFFAILYNRTTLIHSLWVSLLFGLVCDLLGAEATFGLHALNNVLVTALIYSQKRHFFEEKSLALGCFSTLISACSTLLQYTILTLLSVKLPMTGKLIVNNFLLMPLIDGVYAVVWFIIPIKIYKNIEKKGLKAFFHSNNTTHENF